MSVYLNVDAAAEYLSLRKPSTLVALYRTRQIEHTKVGREVVFKIEWLDAYADAHRVPVEERPFGLTDTALSNIRSGRSTRKAS